MSTALLIKEGDKLPEVELESYPAAGKKKTSEFRGKWLVLYFYPRDDTPGCTKEACGFRDTISEIAKLGANVVGVSTDSVDSHRRFHEKYSLNFPLLSDPEGKLGREIGVLNEGSSRPSMRRVTLLVDPKGVVRKIYPKVDPTVHSDEVVRDLKKFIAS
ncbi:MAG: peroxiredoxin [Nitrososphaerota archaeon]|jgi:peroxiredoxin Q/BCP|nr:peroxiredoxin [Nitrososphaerota archaeon]